MQLPYELITLPFPPRIHAKEFLEINPLGTVPYMADGDIHMTESTGICHYLATRYGRSDLTVPASDTDYGVWLNALYQSDATLTFPQALVLRYSMLEPPERRQPQVAEDYTRWFLGRLRWLDSRLDSNRYIAAGRFTIADIAVGYALKLADVLQLLPNGPQAVQSYWRRLSERDGYARATAAQGPNMPAFLKPRRGS